MAARSARESFDSLMGVFRSIVQENSDSEVRKAEVTKVEVKSISPAQIDSADATLSNEDNLTERRRNALLRKLPESIEKLSTVTNELTSILLLLKSERLPKAEASTLFQAKFAELGNLLSVE